MNLRSGGAFPSLLLAAVMALSSSALTGCDDDSRANEAGRDGKGGSGGTASPGTLDGGDAGGDASSGAAGGGGVGGMGGGAPSCDCGDDKRDLRPPLGCACAAGLCTSFADEVAKYTTEVILLPEPYYVLVGTCADGYRTLSYEYAFENSVRSTYDASGKLVFQNASGYGRPLLEACGVESDGTPGRVTIGEDLARDCSFCLLGDGRAGRRRRR